VEAEISASNSVPSRLRPLVSYDDGAGRPSSRALLIASTRGSSEAGTRPASGSPSSSAAESNPYISAVARLANSIRWSFVTDDRVFRRLEHRAQDRFAAAHLRLGPPPLGDVLDRAEKGDMGAIGRGHRVDRQLGVERRAVAAPRRHLAHPRTGRVDGLADARVLSRIGDEVEGCRPSTSVS
jgi:hypothetical protein